MCPQNSSGTCLCHFDKLTPQAGVSDPNWIKQNHSSQKLAVVIEGVTNDSQHWIDEGLILELLKDTQSQLQIFCIHLPELGR